VEELFLTFYDFSGGGYRRIIMLIQYILSLPPVFDFFVHYFFAIGADVVEGSSMTLTRLSNHLLRFLINFASAIIAKFKSYEEIGFEALEVFVEVFRADIPSSTFKFVIITHKRSIKRNP